MASPGRDDAITGASGQPGSWQGLPRDLRWERTGGAGGAPGKGFGAQGCNIPPHATGPRLESMLVPGEAPTCSRGRKTWHQLNQALLPAALFSCRFIVVPALNNSRAKAQ